MERKWLKSQELEVSMKYIQLKLK